VDGAVRIATILDAGTVGGAADQLNLPPGVAVDAVGATYVADLNNDRIEQTTPGGSVRTLADTGSSGFNGDGMPAASDGVTATAPFLVPVLPDILTAGGYPAQVLFAGEAPGYAGLLQIKARLPGGIAPKGNVPSVLSVGTASSQPGVTIAVVE